MSYDLGRGRRRYVVVEISAEDNVKTVEAALKKAGLAGFAKHLRDRTDKYTRKALRAAANAALDATIPNVPRDTGELADDHVKSEIKGTDAIVYVDTKAHYGRRNTPEEAASLAEFLNLGGDGTQGGEKLAEDKGWVKRSQQEYARTYKQAIKRAISNA